MTAQVFILQLVGDESSPTLGPSHCPRRIKQPEQIMAALKGSCMTQINACCLSPRLAAKHYLKKRKANLRMTTLFRQGVESVCKSKRQTQSTGLSGQREPRWRWGRGGAEHRAELGVGFKESRLSKQPLFF